MQTAPNVIMILADDLGWRDLGCTGSDFYETPHLDRLAGQGARLTSAYATAPNCSPSRASLLTGRYPARIGLTQIVGGHSVGRMLDVPSFGQLPRQEYTYARAFRAAGYQTWHLGKWHLGPKQAWPERHGFEENRAGCDRGAPLSWTSPYRLPTLTDGPDGEHLTERLTDEAITLIDRAAAARTAGTDTRPFLLNLWHYAVHTPLSAPPELVAHFEAKAERLGLREDDHLVDAGPYPTWQTHQRPLRRRIRQSHPVYAAMIAHLDAEVGRLLAHLDSVGLAEDTVVVFSSDNGGLHVNAAPTANLPLADGKGYLTEGGIRVPLLIRAPGVTTPGTVLDTPVTLADLFPTLLELTGQSLLPDRHVDGRSLVGVLADPSLGQRPEMAERPLFWHFPHYNYGGGVPASAVRMGRWKLIRGYEDASEQLYDLADDPYETQDRRNTEPAVHARLSAELDRWLTEVHASIPRLNPVTPFDEYVLQAATDAAR